MTTLESVALTVGLVLAILEIIDTYIDICDKWPRWRNRRNKNHPPP